MGTIELLLISLGLAMDAFAVAVCKGLSMKKINVSKPIIVGIWFGFFQALMPTIGYYLGTKFESFITSINHLAAFILLVFIGINMIRESFKEAEDTIKDDLGFKSMFILAIATSIDALTIGITFAFFNINILIAVLMIGVVTFILSVFGVIIGNKFGDKCEKRAQIMGGSILICLGIKNLLEHFRIL